MGTVSEMAIPAAAVAKRMRLKMRARMSGVEEICFMLLWLRGFRRWLRYEDSFLKHVKGSRSRLLGNFYGRTEESCGLLPVLSSQDKLLYEPA